MEVALFLFPVSIVISAIAMMAGIGGAVMFTPLFISVLGFEPLIALATGLVVEFFGFTSGLFGYLKQREVDLLLVKRLAFFSVPATVLGVIFGRFVPVQVLQFLLVALLFFLAYAFWAERNKCEPKHPHFTGKRALLHHKPAKVTDRIKGLTFLGGMLVGMVSTGLGEINEYDFLEKLRMKPGTAAGTSIALVVLSAVIGAVAHMVFLLREGGVATIGSAWPVLFMIIPGVIIGAQIGVRLANHVATRVMTITMSLLFIVLGMLTGLSTWGS